MILLLFATLLGSVVTFLALLPHGVLIALLAFPFGGSAACLLAAAVLYVIRLAPAESPTVEDADRVPQPQ